MQDYTTSKVGALPFLSFAPLFLQDPVRGSAKFINQYKDFAHVRLWKGQEMRLINHPTLYQHILLGNEANYSRRKPIKALDPLLGNGLLMAEGAFWEAQRNRLKPAFHGKMIKDYDLAIADETDRAIERWKLQNSILLENEMQYLLLRIMVRTLFHHDAAIDEPQMVAALKAFLLSRGLLGQELQYAANFLTKYTGGSINLFKKGDRALAWIQQQAQRFLQLARQRPEGTGWFLQILLDAVNAGEIPESQLIDEINNMLFAGFDTTAAAINWTLHELSFSSDWQHRAREEAMAFNNPSTESALQLSLIRQAVQEGMRLYPPAWSFFRTAREAETIGNIHITKGAYLMFCPYAMHRRPDIWEEAEAFNPERFGRPLPHPFAYIPFGHGPRICIGQRLATVQSAWVVASFLRKFELMPPKERHPKFNGGVILVSKKPLAYPIKHIG